MPAARARIGVIGAGWWASMAHLPSLVEYERADVTCIADPNADNRAAVTAAFGVTRAYNDHRDLLASGDVDGVVIAVPHAYHYEIARDALDAGKHVLLEKPMTLRAADAWDLVDRAKARGVHLVIGYETHFSRHAVAARDLVQSGAIGELRFVSSVLASMVESYYRGLVDDYGSVFDFSVTKPDARTYSDPAISGGGQGVTQVTHAMGAVFWITGSAARDVSAFVDGFGLDVDLVDAISFRMVDGAVGTTGSTGSLRPGQPWTVEFRYYGSEGFLVHDTVRGELAVYLNDGTEVVHTPLEPHEISPPSAPARCLADLVLGDGDNLAPGEVGARVVEFLEAAYRSAAERRVVSIDELPSELSIGS